MSVDRVAIALSVMLSSILIWHSMLFSMRAFLVVVVVVDVGVVVVLLHIYAVYILCIHGVFASIPWSTAPCAFPYICG